MSQYTTAKTKTLTRSWRSADVNYAHECCKCTAQTHGESSWLCPTDQKLFLLEQSIPGMGATKNIT